MTGTPPIAVQLTVNGKAARHAVTPRTHLADFLRDDCRLTSVHLGCEHGVCGACTVLVDGDPVRSCITFAAACGDRHVHTVEGLEDDDVMARLRRSFSVHHALQCGFCTPAMLITARDIVRRFPTADEARIRLELAGNLCRCTGYLGIVAAIGAVLEELGGVRSAGEASAVTAPTGTPVVAAPAGALPAASMHSAAAASGATMPAAAEPVVPRSSALRPGWSSIDDSFVVPFPRAQVWAFMADLRSVSSCLPGAELEDHDDKKVRGRIAVKFGPMSASFAGAAILERDEEGYRSVMRGAGQDSISRSRANGDVTYALSEEAGGTQTRVAVRLEYMLQGPLAQFSRSGLVKEFVRRMMADFGAHISERLGGSAAPPGTAVPQSLNAGRLVWSAIWIWVKRLFRGRD